MTAHTPHYQRIFDAIKTLHYNHGIGDIKQIRLFMDGRIEVVAKPTSCPSKSTWGRLVGGQTIKMYRHQVTVKEQP